MATTSGLVNCVLVQSTTGYCEIRRSGSGGAIETFLAWSGGGPTRLHRMWVDLLSDAAANGKTVEITHAAGSAQIDNVQLAGTQPNSVANLLAWYRSDSLVGTPEITSWNDLASDAGGPYPLDAFNGTPDDQEPALNSNTVVNLDGTEQIFRSNSFTMSFPLTLFLVIRPDAFTTDRNAVFLSGTGSAGATPRVGVNFDSTSFGTVGYDGTSRTAEPAGAPAAGNWGLYVAKWIDGGTIQGAWNYGAFASTGVAALTAADGICLGGTPAGSNGYDCAIAEAALYEADITGDDLTNLRNYFTDRYLL